MRLSLLAMVLMWPGIAAAALQPSITYLPTSSTGHAGFPTNQPVVLEYFGAINQYRWATTSNANSLWATYSVSSGNERLAIRRASPSGTVISTFQRPQDSNAAWTRLTGGLNGSTTGTLSDGGDVLRPAVSMFTLRHELLGDVTVTRQSAFNANFNSSWTATTPTGPGTISLFHSTTGINAVEILITSGADIRRDRIDLATMTISDGLSDFGAPLPAISQVVEGAFIPEPAAALPVAVTASFLLARRNLARRSLSNVQ